MSSPPECVVLVSRGGERTASGCNLFLQICPSSIPFLLELDSVKPAKELSFCSHHHIDIVQGADLMFWPLPASETHQMSHGHEQGLAVPFRSMAGRVSLQKDLDSVKPTK